MSKMYDVYFTLETPAVILVRANSKDEAEEIMLNMDEDELINRIKNSIDFMGLKVVDIERVK